VRVESVDMFYLSMPEVRDVGDGSQDMLLVRVRAGGWTGWGECEAAPLPSIAALVCPLSHSACHPVLDSVLGERLDGPQDIERIGRLVRSRSLDLLQAAHTLSGIEIALWDLLGKLREQPVYELLGFARAFPRTPYASRLFGDTPQQTLELARDCVAQGYRAVKFGWGPYGTGTVSEDADQVHAAREGLGVGLSLMVDAGTVWDDDVTAAAARLPALADCDVVWLEEPFVGGAVRSYAALAAQAGAVRIAGGEGAHDAHLAEQLIDHGRVGFVQIDTGRIGGIAPAHAVSGYARSHGVQFVNHTFTSHLALSASLQPNAGVEEDWVCEYPVDATRLATRLTRNRIELQADGLVAAPAAPGLGLAMDLDAVREYLVPVEITVAGRTLHRTAELTS
jgi:L-alanine-DL-glutamate epimerase-like enolase superfamily enzyme